MQSPTEPKILATRKQLHALHVGEVTGAFAFWTVIHHYNLANSGCLSPNGIQRPQEILAAPKRHNQRNNSTLRHIVGTVTNFQQILP
ncbi:hypothetical protein FHX52_1970 [Humibacillus xanthopallidus]|uniref:Uncharacterized protein n=1 Tax=Humibacillus xanthopallidus TaxID=412689 RepID=A0A543PXK6_9MICO|nr:hypothetical protein FHX52_1970 [Humibacillus xanthopallidus]